MKEIYIKVSNVCSNIIGTTACLKHKEEVSMYDLLYGLMLPSGNDAAAVLAEGIGTMLYMEENDEKEKIKELKRIMVKTKKIYKKDN